MSSVDSLELCGPFRLFGSLRGARARGGVMVLAAAMQEGVSLVQDAKADDYNGVLLSLDTARHGNFSVAGFVEAFERALEEWRQRGRRGIWLRVPTALAPLAVPAAVQLGFDFHDARPGHTTLTKWLPDSPCTLPPPAHHLMGVGSLVLDCSGRRILVVQENSGPTVRYPDFWKLPGGHVDKGEDLADAAVREVFEETGVRTVFDCIATVHEMPQGDSGTTVLYAICVLRIHDCYGGEAPTPVAEAAEIAAVEWRDLDVFLGSRYHSAGLYGTMLKTAASVAIRHRERQDIALTRTRIKGLTRKEESLYLAGGKVLERSSL